jgi:DNA-binding response OmpR family regulator
MARPSTLPQDPTPVVGRGPRRGGETVLLIGDALAACTAEPLQALGYRVLRAATACAALEMLRAGVHADLLFTRSELRGIEELAAQARLSLPGIAVLLTGSRSVAAARSPERVAPGAEFLPTPFAPEELACRVRHVLGNQQQVNALARVLGQRRPVAATGDTRWRVLLVEDHDDLRDTSRQLLELLGCEVQAVPDANAADDALQHARFDVMLTDVMLPGRSGLELARAAALRQPTLRIVVSSGHGAQSNGVAGLRTWTLPKPYGVQELQALLGELQRA